VIASWSKSEARSLLEETFSMEFDDALVIGTVGRLVPRKGVAWFIEHVLPLLPADTTYLVAGHGDEVGRIRDLALASPGSVVLLGQTSDDIKHLVYRACDVFVMPNRKVAGDMEGFGLVALEAGANGTPVVASSLDGIRDAVLNGETGLLVDPQDPAAFAEAIVNASEWESEGVGRIVREAFSWERVYEAYREALRL
jgi:glycosyltransferase involved in cell wall biosynthesis